AAFNGPAIAGKASRPERDQALAEDASKAMLALPHRAAKAVIYATILGGWLTERRAFLSHRLEKDAKATVTLKDGLVAGVVATGIACFVMEEVMRRSARRGALEVERSALAPAASAGADLRRYFKLMSALNRTLVAGAIGATPFINFALFNDYRPKPL